MDSVYDSTSPNSFGSLHYNPRLCHQRWRKDETLITQNTPVADLHNAMLTLSCLLNTFDLQGVTDGSVTPEDALEIVTVARLEVREAYQSLDRVAPFVLAETYPLWFQRENEQLTENEALFSFEDDTDEENHGGEN